MTIFWFLLGLLGFQEVFAYDQCKDLCKNVKFDPKLEQKQLNFRLVCHRGCQLFNILHHTFKTSTVKQVRDKCNRGCISTYVKEDPQAASVCRKGCALMSWKRMTDLSSVFVKPPNDVFVSDIPTLEPNIQELEASILNNPLLKKQIEEGSIDGYKIPEKQVKTMPIIIPDPNKIIQNIQESEDWLSCASRNSGIPKWILFTVMLTAILVAICLSLSVDTKVKMEDLTLINQVLIEMGQRKSLAGESSCLTDQERQFLDDYFEENEIEFDIGRKTPPPKYWELF